MGDTTALVEQRLVPAAPPPLPPAAQKIIGFLQIRYVHVRVLAEDRPQRGRGSLGRADDEERGQQLAWRRRATSSAQPVVGRRLPAGGRPPRSPAPRPTGC